MRKLVILVSVVVLALAFAMAAPAFAAKGGQGKGGGNGGGKGKPGGGGDSSLTLVVVTDVNEDTLPNWGDQVSFDVSTTATDRPHVSLKCYQDGTLVYTTQTGYYEDYPWPWTQVMTLSSGAWTGGAADCTAELYYFSGKKTVKPASISFTAGE